jgi:hypothetical protein
VPSPVPDVGERRAARRDLHVLGLLEPRVLVAVVLERLPVGTERQQLAVFARQAEQRAGLLAISLVVDIRIRARFDEHRPEVIVDHVGRHRAGADRAADEAAHEILGVIQHELVARLGRNRGKGRERIGALGLAVNRQRAGRPRRGEEQLVVTLEPRIVERIDDVVLLDDALGHQPEAVIERRAVRARIVVGRHRRDRIERLAAGRARAQHFEEMRRLAVAVVVLKINVRDEQMLVQVTRHQLFARAGAIQVGFPIADRFELGVVGFDRRRLDHCTLSQPGVDGVELGVAEACDRVGHALVGMLFRELVELLDRRAFIGMRKAHRRAVRQTAVRLPAMRFAERDHVAEQRGLQHRHLVVGAGVMLGLR